MTQCPKEGTASMLYTLENVTTGKDDETRTGGKRRKVQAKSGRW